MKCFALVLIVGISSGILHGMELRQPPDAGISNDELEKLGNDADLELLKRFSEPAKEGFREAIMMRMYSFGNLSKPNPKIRKALIGFVEGEATECAGEVANQRIWNIGMALELIGERGGAQGLDYLTTWIREKSVYGRLKCFSHGSDEGTSQSQVRRGALIGIGLNGTTPALNFLLDVAKNRPPDKFPGSFEGVLNGAISENKLIQKEGADKHFKSDRKFFSRRISE